MATCRAISCKRAAIAKGLCSMHWKRERKHGDCNYVRHISTFWERVEFSDSCWIWKGHTRGNASGQYGIIDIAGKRHSAHRYAWIIRNGPIPKLRGTDYRGTCVLHRCDNGLCVNPDHLRLGSHTDNMRDKIAKGRDTNANKKYCVNGHRRNPKNTYLHKKTNCRQCRVCAKLRERRKRHLAKRSA